MEQNLIQKESNILDPIHDTLDQDVFNGTTPKTAFFEYHLDHIREVFRQNNFNPYAFDFYLTGSLCTYQYSDKSDVDISIVCNADEFDEEDRADLIGIVIESLDGTFFPRTKHQYQHFVQPIGVDIEDLFVLGLRSAWDFQKNEWVLKPKRPTREIKKEKPDWILAGVQMSDKINTLIDNHKYEEAKLMYKKVHQKRKEDQIDYGDFSEGNVIYKFLDNNGTFDRLRNIGQRIAFQKQALATDDYIDYYYNSTFYNSSAYPKTHLNARGYPCSCSFGKKDMKSVHQYYKNLSKNEEIKISLNKTSNEKEESKIRDMAQKILDKQIDSESKWAKKYPLWKERVQTKIIDENRLQENSIKFFAGLLNLYKKEIQKLDPNSNSLNYANILNTREERVSEQKETFRTLWTGNFGKNTKIGQSDFFYDLDLFTFPESESAYNLISQIERMLYRNINLDENVRLVWSQYYDIQTEIDADPEIKSIINQIDNIVESKIQEMAKTEHLDYGFLTTLDLVTRMSKNRFGELRENAKDILEMMIDGSLLKMRPEELLDFYVQDKFNYPFRDTITDSLANVIYEMNAFRLQYLLNEYKDLRFPTNLEGMNTFGDVSREVRMIEVAAKEREEYKTLLKQFKNGEVSYDSNTPVFTFEVKKGNPEKAKPGTWGVYRLDSTSDLELEGDICSHCIGSWDQHHIRRRAEDLNTVYSVRDPDGVPWVTVELDKEGVVLGQAFGRHDHAVRQNEQKILNAFFGQESFQRNSSKPNRYYVLIANGEEYEYDADSVEDAVNQHNQDIDKYVGSAEEKQVFKPVAAYGAGHNWFNKPLGTRTGIYYDDDIPMPEEDIETVEDYISAEDYWDISSVPDVNYTSNLSELWQWVEENYNNYEPFVNFLSYAYPDEDTDVQELERNDYGEAIIRVVEPLSAFTGEHSKVYNFIDNIVSIYSNSIFDEDGDVTDEVWDLYETIKGLGSYIIITLLYSSTPQRQFDTILNSYDHYLQKKTSTYSKNNGKKQIAIINAIRTVLNSFKQFDLYDVTINDMYNDLENNDAISSSLEIEYGSWDYANNFEESYINVEDVEAKPLPKSPIDRGNESLLNYLQYGIDLCDEINNILNTYFHTRNDSPIQRTMWFNQEENTITEGPTELEPQQTQPGDTEEDKERKMRQQDFMREEVVQSGIYRTKIQELFDIIRFVSEATQINVGPVKYLGAGLNSYNAKKAQYDLDHISNLFEYIKSIIYKEKELPDTRSGQMSFYEMPPEPTTEEFERWQQVQEGLLATSEPYKAPTSWPSGVGYLNG